MKKKKKFWLCCLTLSPLLFSSRDGSESVCFEDKQSGHMVTGEDIRTDRRISSSALIPQPERAWISSSFWRKRRLCHFAFARWKQDYFLLLLQFSGATEVSLFTPVPSCLTLYRQGAATKRLWCCHHRKVEYYFFGFLLVLISTLLKHCDGCVDLSCK